MSELKHITLQNNKLWTSMDANANILNYQLKKPGVQVTLFSKQRSTYDRYGI